MRKISLLLSVKILIVALFFFCINNPVDHSSPEYAASNIVLVSSTSGTIDTVIVENTGKQIGLIVTYVLGYFIDSIYIDIYSDSSFKAAGAPDSQIIVRFGEDDVRDTTRFNVRFSTEGIRYFVVRTFKRQGYISFDTAVAKVYSLYADTMNHVPIFMHDTPKRIYYVDDGDMIGFKVHATDIDNDILEYDYFFPATPLPRQNEGLLGEDGFFRWQSKSGDKGIYHVVFHVSDGNADTTTLTTLVVGDTTYNSPPEITSTPPDYARFGMQYEYRPEAKDEETPEPLLSWELIGKRPDGMRFDSTTGRIYWIPKTGTRTSGVLLLKVTDDGIPPQSDSQKIEIRVLSGKPEAISRSVATDSATPVKIALIATDPENSVLEFAITDTPRHGSAVLRGIDTILYTPFAEFKGVDTIRFIACDEAQCSDTAMIKIYVAADNQPPDAKAQQLSTREDTPLPLQLHAEDIDGDSLTYMVVKSPRHGGINGGSSGNRIYIPHVNFAGADTFTFIANDGRLDSDPATVIIKIIAVNDTPVVMNMGVPTPLNTPVTITLRVSDPDDSLFTFKIIRLPVHGAIDTSGLPSLRYIPVTGYKGADTILYRAIDNQGCPSAPGRIVILIGSNKKQPIAISGSLTVAEDSSIAFELQGSDAEGAPLASATFVITGQPRHGTLSGTESLRKYRPDGNFWGADTFSFTVSDGVLVSNPSIMTVTVTPVNDTPVAQSKPIWVKPNTQITIHLDVVDADIDDTAFTYRITDQPKHGTLETSQLSKGRLQYTPDKDYIGGDTLRFVARDDSGAESKPAAVIITVAGNTPPVAYSQPVTLNEDETKTIFLEGSDRETSMLNLTFAITGDPVHGRLEGTLPNVTYRPDTNYNGDDMFYFTVSDDSLASEPARVRITILAVNDTPVAAPQLEATPLNTPVPITLEAKDEDGFEFTYEITSMPRHGTIDTASDIKNGRITYTPSNDYKGYDTLFYRAFDEELLASKIVDVIIGVGLVELPPVADTQTVTLDEDKEKWVILTGRDPDGDSLTFAITKKPNHGSTTNEPPYIRYTPDADYNGTDTLFFIVNDGTFSSDPAIVKFIIKPVNDTPVANPVLKTAELNTTTLIALDGHDVDGGTIRYRITRMPKHGTLDTSDIIDAWVRYTPAVDYRGNDTALYVAIDQSGLESHQATLIVRVAPNMPP
ncbi:MAG: tandem-95 repeat protein, partial [Chitinispirillaceae bacterium]|nr:tandem-95 repeat protein [Chitinispirillaceae bacterium]